MAYVISKRQTTVSEISYLPLEITLPKTKDKISLDFYKDSDYDQVYAMLKDAVDEGQTYPQETMDKQHFEQYYLSFDVIVARESTSGKVAGSFYIKPNFPGRSSHICNAGFLVNRDFRRKGVGEELFRNYLRIAKDLGYEGSFFNLVYASNVGSLRICRKLGFKEIGVVPKAGKMKGLGYVDAVQFYYDLSTYEHKDV